MPEEVVEQREALNSGKAHGQPPWPAVGPTQLGLGLQDRIQLPTSTGGAGTGARLAEGA